MHREARHYFKNAPGYNREGHECEDEPMEKSKILEEIRKLMAQLENVPCIPRPPVPPDLTFLEKKQPRFRSDPSDMPTITHLPMLELRPTSDYKLMMKDKNQGSNVIYINVNPPLSTHSSPPWALPSPGSGSPEMPDPCLPPIKCVCCPHIRPK